MHCSLLGQKVTCIAELKKIELELFDSFVHITYRKWNVYIVNKQYIF